MSGCGREASRISKSGRKHSRMSGSGRKATRMSRSGQEDLPDVREWSEGTHRCPGVVERPSWVVGRPSRMSERGW